MRMPPTRADRLGSLALLLAIAAAVALIAMPHAAEQLAGIPPAVALRAPDDVPPASKDDPTSFLLERDQLVIRVAQATTLRDFLERNRLGKPTQRKQIVEQLGSASPDAAIAAGTTFRIRLTPSARDVPGTP